MALWRTRRRRRRVELAHRIPVGALVLVLVGGVFVLSSHTPQHRNSASKMTTSSVVASDYDFSGHAVHVVDGDTFRISSRPVSIRVWGIDAPEIEEFGGVAATAALTQLISGQHLRCRQRDIDRYGRIVGQCVLADGRDVAAEMIASGTAREFCRFSSDFYGTC